MLLVIHSGATLLMTGLIWFVQVVHYPLFRLVGTDGFAEYERRHQRLTGYVVMPLMLIELFTAVWLAIEPGRLISPLLAIVNLLLLVAIWLSTFFLQVPLHRRLTKGSNAKDTSRLVATNWIRTALWSIRSGLLLWVIAKLII